MKQKKRNWCGPACLTWLSWGTINQAEAADIMKTDASGTSPAGLRIGLRRFGIPASSRRKPPPRYSMGIVYDYARDHWLAFIYGGESAIVFDPETGLEHPMLHDSFQLAFMMSKHSYLLYLK